MTAAWEDIVNTSIIGTDKKQIAKNILPAEIISIAEEIEKSGADREDTFLKLASVIYAYRRGGYMEGEERMPQIPECEPEELSYCSQAASGSLQASFGEENDSLLLLWLHLCSKNKKIVSPEFVATLLDKAERNKELKPYIVSCTGKRGAWMSAFNPQWNFASEENKEEIFKTGLTEERRQALTNWRKVDPAAALQALASVWKEEQAALKAEFLSILEINLSNNDLDFLSEAWKEKSQKVREVALQLLKKIPQSFVVTEAWNFLKPLISAKKSSAMFGLLNKDSIEINLNFEVPDNLKAYGISHIDASKQFSEKEFSVNQLLAMVPPSFLCEHLNLKPEAVLEQFAKNDSTKKYLPAIASAASSFGEIEWGILLFSKYEILCEKLISRFEPSLREKAALKALSDNQRNIYSFLPDRVEEWSLNFTLGLLEKTSQEPYSYTRQYYKNIIHHFPLTVFEKIDNIAVTDELKNNYWKNIAEEIKQMLAVKKQIIESF